ncbi:hypothetical protein [Bordetella bronchiseptica]|uniref:hypothetical protein n=1 Tax=Bordetella bronchiseptica TaxID=518 RepID=UPI00028FF104|nr:hypothetical protein [Bordetella bronchiseptica]KCV25519.1 hypothetical protein L489_5099 [Bordetella bronchiseptica 00-P-2730]KAK51891.1 hypothetical protein L576_4915 [Bordetella bronchiseptica OSU054]KCV57551.1 hypothetical protein L492_4695 [Bordetella bronchiseptica 7E71]KDB74742.1 hypothetical protein L494_4768 [Bordetella bronchiseptica CA90 BB1334]KDC93617.1 hypothetical protein L518_4383 [Bordetella bronchiseptica MBORD675]
MYVILTNKPGQFHTEAGPEFEVVEEYDYLFYGQRKAIYQIAALRGEAKVAIVEEGPGAVVNHVPSKFLEKFESVQGARDALTDLTRFGSMQAELVRRDA